MKTLKERILEGFKNYTEEEIFDDPMHIAFAIACIAHDGQTRENGDSYLCHPERLVDHFKWLIRSYKDKRIHEEVLVLNGLPYYGVAEVSYLHDVVEDTDITHEQIKEIFDEYGFGGFFNEFIDEPLRLISHDKSEPYEIYIKKVMTNPISAFVKLLDLSDNLNPFGLMHLGEKEVERSKRYLDYFKMINDKYLFLAKLINARRMEDSCKEDGRTEEA